MPSSRTYAWIAALFFLFVGTYAIVSLTVSPGQSLNTFGNIAGITTPIVIGYILQATGSFAGALVFVGANAAMAIISYLFIVGEIKRVTLKPSLVN